MKIKLTKFYQNVRGQSVPPGEHDAKVLPPGLATYLVENGHAVVTDDTPISTPPDIELTVGDGVVDLNNMTKAELVAFAAENGIDVSKGDLKANIKQDIESAL